MLTASGSSVREKWQMTVRTELVVREASRLISDAAVTTMNNTTGNSSATMKLIANPTLVETPIAICSMLDEIGWTMTAALAKAAETTMIATAAISTRELSLPTEERTGSIRRSRPGAPATITMLSCGQAFTQSI